MMNKPARIVVVSCLFLTCCEHAENYRWASDTPTPVFGPVTPPAPSAFDWQGPSVNVYTYATPSPTATSTHARDLSDRGQAAFIEAVSKPHTEASKLESALSSPFGNGSNTEGVASVDETYNRTLVATVSEALDATPADRLVWTWIDIRPRNFLFDSYTVAQTDNETLNIEAIQNQTTASLQGQYGATTSNTGAATTTTAPASGTAGTTISDALTKVLGTSAGVSGSLSNQYTTSANISQQYEKLHVDIVPQELRIFRGSERNLDVTGNTIVVLTLRVNPDSWHNPAREVNVQRVTKLTVTKSGKMLPAKKIDLGVALEKAPPHCALLADIRFLYELRRVSDARSYVEGEQRPQYIQQTAPTKTIELVPAHDVRPPTWRTYNTAEPDWPVYLSDTFGQQLPLDFSTYEQARDLSEWMNAQGRWNHRSRLRVGSSGYTLTSGTGNEFPEGRFFAKRFDDRPAAAEECAGMAPVTAGTNSS